MFGECCCYCGEGSPVVSYVASSPLGPYTAQGTVTSAIPAQQTNIAPFNTPSGVEYMWVGDRWQSAPDHIKGHDFTYWGVLSFDEDGNVLPLPFQDSFQVNVISK